MPAILAAPSEDLVKVAGIGETVAACIKAIAELHSRAGREEIKAKEANASLSAPVACLRRELQHEQPEQFRVIFPDRGNQRILDEIMGRGAVDHSPVYPREISRRALELQASSLILVHNHSPGAAKPSRADVGITREIMDVPRPFEISVHDHLVAGTSGIVSFRTYLRLIRRVIPMRARKASS